MSEMVPYPLVAIPQCLSVCTDGGHLPHRDLPSSSRVVPSNLERTRGQGGLSSRSRHCASGSWKIIMEAVVARSTQLRCRAPGKGIEG